MSKRRHARESALQILFQLEFDIDHLDAVVEKFWKTREPDEEEREYCRYLVHGVDEHRKEIDHEIQANSKNWRISRMDLVDRNILRLAAFELMYDPDLAAAIIINEAVEIAKKFGGEDSPTFVNGVLDGMRKRIKNPQGNKRERYD
jgi:transcription antitermination protein NusB